ncbi:hypothetical protein BRADI_1g28729v3 [Brachypodium distachyon]|uniref:CCHC-type domain-containing protein n=1 Tax=Brachypodium distachyon TaxID=15368 RepID=A0A2K2DLR7_BRADI|nr:hypothetical protein BRADI_1g28729v3 [Brachypodium distachyon]
MTGKEFEELALDGRNNPTWAMDVKVSLASRGLSATIQPPQEGQLPSQIYTNIMPYITIRNHIHADLKLEYYDIIHVLLQAEKHDELLMRNHHQRPVAAAPLPQVHANFQKNNKQAKGQQKNKPRVQEKGKGTFKPQYDKSKVCQKCGCYKHITKKCRTPRHLVDLYLQSVGRKRPSHRGPRFESHFNFQSDNSKEAGCSHDIKEEPSNNPTIRPSEDLTSTENMIIEFTSNDMFGDIN